MEGEIDGCIGKEEYAQLTDLRTPQTPQQNSLRGRRSTRVMEGYGTQRQPDPRQLLPLLMGRRGQASTARNGH